MKRSVAAALLVLIILSSCGSDLPSEKSLMSPLAQVSLLATSEAEIANPTPIPNPLPNKGAITGRLVNTSGRPVAEMLLYLGEISPLDIEGSKSHIITIIPASSPSTTTDKYGYFAFNDINPGTYAIVVWTPVNSWVVSDPETELDVLVTVKAGIITDLGEIAVELP